MRAPRLARRLASISSQIGEQRVGIGVAGLRGPLQQILEALADEAQLAAIRLVEVLVADRSAKAASSCSSSSIERNSSSETGTMRVETPVARASARTSLR